MSMPDTSERRPPIATEPTGDIFMTLVSAALFLYVGFWSSFDLTGESALLDRAIVVFNWGARIVGVGLLLVAGLLYLRVRGAALLDLVLAALATLICAVPGAIWIGHGYTRDGFLVLVFALINASATRGAWLHWQALRVVPPPPDAE
jgi:hypothetical protein